MRTHLTRRTKTALLAGVVLVVTGGGGAAYLGTRKAAVDTSVGKVPTYFAVTAVPAGTPAATAIGQGAIRPRLVLPADRPANGITDASQLTGRVAGTTIPVGTLVTTDMFPDPQTHIGTVVIPPGKRALALELQPVAGVAGFAGAGDRIDVYGVSGADGTPPSVRLVLQGVDVLNVNGTALPAAQGQPGSANLIYLLAVTPAEAERLIYLNSFAKLYFDLVPKNEGPVRTPGVGPSTALAA